MSLLFLVHPPSLSKKAQVLNRDILIMVAKIVVI